ncbi:ABC transporter C member 13 [Podila verticillata]|nr:ABC transporter C member 13 [Podila verticillata]
MDKAYVIKSIPSNEKSGIDYAKVPGLAPRQEGECLLASSPEIEKQQLQTNRWNLGSLRTGLYIRIALIDLVFRKATTLSAQAHLLYPDGAIINLMTTDISRIDSAMMPMLIVISGPIYIMAVIGLLIRLVGPSALFGAMILMAPNPIQAVKAIKIFAWEPSFLKRLADISESRN